MQVFVIHYLEVINNIPAVVGPASSAANPQPSPACAAITPTKRGRKLVTGEMSEVTLSTTPDFPGCVA